MAPNWSMGNSYTDDRRNSGPYLGASTYRPGERDRPPQAPRRNTRDRDRETRSPREQLRENEPPREPRRDNEPPREPRRDNEPPRLPNIEATNFRAPEGPRKTSTNSPASAIDRLGSDLHFNNLNIEKSMVMNTATNDAPTSAIPKARNPDLQEAFENAFKWGEKSNKRLLLGMRVNKAAQESALRDLDNGKYQTKAASYPPFHALRHKSNPADQNLKDELNAAENDYLNELEQLVARFTAVAKPVADNQQDPVVAALEAKVKEISETAAKQSEQIQKLLEGGNNSWTSITSIETEFSSMKLSHSDLEAKYTALKSDHETLQSKLREHDDAIHALESKQAVIDAENMSLKKQLNDLRSDTEEKLELSDAQLTELAKKTSEIADFRKTFETGLEERTAGIEAKLHDYDDVKDKLDELDLTTLNEICDAWVSSEYNLKTQYEEYKERRGQDHASIDNMPRSHRQEVNPLQSSRPDVFQPDRGPTLSIQEVEDIINAKVAIAEQAINSNSRAYSEKKDDLFAELLSGVEEQLNDTMKQEASKHARLEARVQSVEQWKAINSASMDQVRSSDLSERVGRLEGQRIGHRVDRIDLDVCNLDQKYEGLKRDVGQLVRREWVEHRLQELLTGAGLVADVKDLQRKVPAIELAIKSLDTQFQNLSTKHLAEHIVRLTNPGFEQRLGLQENKTKQLESKTNGHDRSINHHTGELAKMSDFLRSTVSGEKRNASPGLLDEASKRRKLEANGRHPSPLQRNNSIQHPSP